VVPLLRAAGHEAVAVDLPADDPAAGLAEYARLAVAAVAGAGGTDGADAPGEVVVVAQSLGGFTAPLVAQQIPVRALVFVNAMIPRPGETAGAWWDNTGWAKARELAAERGGYGTDIDLDVYFMHDVPPEIAASGEPHRRQEADAAFASRCDFDAWPAVPIRVAAGADDRFFPVAFQQGLARDRLGVEAAVLPGGHLNALSQPGPLADYLLERT
jgi:predicted alpha/beta hydrolase family esterase